MKDFRQKFRRNKAVKLLTSVKLTVVFLLLLFILTLWGTVAQVHQGLYLAQDRYFHSFFFLAMGFLPFPGGQLVMWALFFNLVAVAIFRLNYKWRHAGIIIIHFGLLSFLVAGFVTMRCAKESFLMLLEGHASNVSSAYHEWEISFWKDQSPTPAGKEERNIIAVSTAAFKPGRTVHVDELDLKLTVKEYCRNCEAFVGSGLEALNASGIQRLKSVPLSKEPERNVPGGVFQMETSGGRHYDVLLFGNESKPTAIEINGVAYNVILRLQRYPLPFTLRLVDFMMEKHPGTNTPRAFKSLVSIETGGAWRDKLISMNNPLRYKDFTLYQASYQIDELGREFSTLAVVKNVGRILPYVSTFVTFGGLALHFIMMAFTARKGVESPYVGSE